jgi:RHS repeat-associated protein
MITVAKEMRHRFQVNALVLSSYMKRQFKWMIVILFLVAVPCSPQQPAATETGEKPFGSFDGTNIESVNLENGQLVFHAPLYSLPQRGNLAVSFSITYQDIVWDNNVSCVLHQCETKILPNPGTTFGVGIVFDQDLRSVNETNIDTGQQYCNGVNCVDYFTTAYNLIQPDRTSHNLAYNGSYYYAVDGSGFAFIPQASSTPPYIPPGETGGTIVPQTGTLIGPSGNQYAVLNGGPTSITDADGNYITIGSSILDTLGRTIPFPGSGSSTSISNCPSINAPYQPLTNAVVWNPPGYQGTANYIICYASMHVSTGQSMPPKLIQFNANEGVIQSIVLPDGTYWGFVYAAANPNNPSSTGNGDLTQIIFPTGGSVSYTWGEYAPSCTDSTGNINSPGGMTTLYPDTVATRTLTANGVGNTWTYTYNEVSSTTTVTDPVGDQVVHTFANLAPGSGCSLYETATQYNQVTQNGGLSTVKTVTTSYQTASGYDGSDNAVAFPTQVTTTWPNGQSATNTMGYDNGSTYYFYNCYYGDPAPVWYCPIVFHAQVPFGKIVSQSNYDYTRSLLNQTQTQYLWQTNSNYLNANLMNTPTSVVVYGSGGTSGGAIAQTFYTYDESAKVRLSPQQSVNTQIGPPPASVYGHLTTTTKWLNGGANPSFSKYWLNTGEIDHTVDANSNTTSFVYSSTYDGAYLTQSTNAKGQSTSFSYDFNSGLKTSEIDANNQTTAYTYDAMSRVTSVSYPDGGSTTIQYNPATYPQNSVLTQVLMCNGGANCLPEEASGQKETTLNVYDGLGRPMETALLSDPSGQPDYTMTAYDALGRVASVTNPYRTTSDSTYGTTNYQYDMLNRMTSLSHSADATSQTWAYSGNETTFTDETGRVWERFNDALGRLTEVLEPDGSTTVGKAPNHETDYQYDGLGDLVRVDQWGAPHGSNGDRVRTFVYDSLARLTQACNPESISPGSTCSSSGPWSNAYTYDADSNLLTDTDARGMVNQYSYDPLNRVQVETNPSGTANACFWYDNSSVSPVPSGCPAPPAGVTTGSYLVGRMAYQWTSDGLTGTGFGYDPMGRTNSELVCTPSTCGKSAYGLAFQYDLAGNQTSYSNGVGVTTTVGYDPASRMAQVTSSYNDPNHPGTLWTANSYGPIGLTQATLGNGIVENAAYDARERKISDSFKNPGNQTIYSYSIAYYANSAVQSVNDNANGNWTYTLDNMNRLYTASASSGPFAGVALQWGIDAWGNRNTQTATAGSAPQPSFSSTTNNQIAGYCYDAAGHMLDEGGCTGGTQQFAYDGVGRLSSPNFGNTVYVYDAAGKRAAKQSGGVSTYEYLYDLSGNVITELTPGGWDRGEVFAGGRHIATYTGGTTYFAHSDWLGDERVHSNLSANVQDSCANLPYGDGLTCPIYGVTPLHFTGKERDSESGNDYFGARYYSSMMGRFMSPDWSAKVEPVPYAKLADPQTLNLYVYVENDALSRVDADGHVGGPNKDLPGGGAQNSGAMAPPPGTECQLGGGILVACGLEAQDINSSIACNGPCTGHAQDGARQQFGQDPTLPTAEAPPLLSKEDITGLKTTAEFAGLVGIPELGGLGEAGVALKAFSETAEAGKVLSSVAEESVSVYQKVETAYVGITNNLVRREAQHGEKLVEVVGDLTRKQARGVEQAIIEHKGLTNLTNKINSIAKTNPIYQEAVQFGKQLLKSIGFE